MLIQPALETDRLDLSCFVPGLDILTNMPFPNLGSNFNTSYRSPPLLSFRFATESSSKYVHEAQTVFSCYARLWRLQITADYGLPYRGSSLLLPVFPYHLASCEKQLQF